MAAPIDQDLHEAVRMLRLGNATSAHAHLQRLLSRNPQNPKIHHHLGLFFAQTGNMPQALDHLATASRLDPASAALHCDLGRLLAGNGQFQAAIVEFRQTASLAPDLVDGWFFLGITLARNGQDADALPALRRAWELAPDRREVLEALADAEFKAGYPDDALPLWRKLCALRPDDATAHMRLGETYSRLGFHDEAIATYRGALAHMPGSADLWLTLAQSLEDAGDRDAALSAYQHAESLRPGWALPISGLLGLQRRQAPDELLARARSLQASHAIGDAERALLGYEIGKALDSQGDTVSAMASWHDANHARRRMAGPLDRQLLSDRIQSLIRTFDRSFFERLATLGNPDKRPVFIVGMPRSGTTLTEQIISMHPHAHGCGELPDIALLANQLASRYATPERPWPAAMSDVPGDVAAAATARYLEVASRHASGQAHRLIDKAPLNFFHLGMIATLFPSAHVIWCRRDPRDIGLSIYSENFALESQFATDLSDLGFYIAQHERLMRHWQAVLPIPLIELRYEHLIESFETESRRLIEAVGLPWDPACLDFHLNQRGVQTPSRWQVRERIHNRSVGRWKPYAAALQPLIDAIGHE